MAQATDLPPPLANQMMISFLLGTSLQSSGQLPRFLEQPHPMPPEPRLPFLQATPTETAPRELLPRLWARVARRLLRLQAASLRLQHYVKVLPPLPVHERRTSWEQRKPSSV